MLSLRSLIYLWYTLVLTTLPFTVLYIFDFSNFISYPKLIKFDELGISGLQMVKG